MTAYHTFCYYTLCGVVTHQAMQSLRRRKKIKQKILKDPSYRFCIWNLSTCVCVCVYVLYRYINIVEMFTKYDRSLAYRFNISVLLSLFSSLYLLGSTQRYPQQIRIILILAVLSRALLTDKAYRTSAFTLILSIHWFNVSHSHWI